MKMNKTTTTTTPTTTPTTTITKIMQNRIMKRKWAFITILLVSYLMLMVVSLQENLLVNGLAIGQQSSADSATSAGSGSASSTENSTPPSSTTAPSGSSSQHRSSSSSSGNSNHHHRSSSSAAAAANRQSAVGFATSLIGALGNMVPGLITNVAPLVLLFGIGALMMPALGLNLATVSRESRRSGLPETLGLNVPGQSWPASLYYPNVLQQPLFGQHQPHQQQHPKAQQAASQDYYYIRKRSADGDGAGLGQFNWPTSGQIYNGLQFLAEHVSRAIENADRQYQQQQQTNGPAATTTSNNGHHQLTKAGEPSTGSQQS